MTHARHFTFSALCLLLLASLQNTRAYMTPGEVFGGLDVEQSEPAPSTKEEDTPANREQDLGEESGYATGTYPASDPSGDESHATGGDDPWMETNEPAAYNEASNNDTGGRTFYRKGKEYDVIQNDVQNEPEAAAAASSDAALPVTTEEPAPADTATEESTEESDSFFPSAPDAALPTEEDPPMGEDGGSSSWTRLLANPVAWAAGAIGVGGAVGLLFLRKKQTVPGQAEAQEEVLAPPPPQDAQQRKHMEAALEAMHPTEDATPAEGSDDPAA